jgi:hypothetical protein
VKFSYTSWDIDATATISVQRDPKALAPVLDPQNWDVCGSKFWKAAFVTLGGDPPTPDPNAPPPGMQWKGILFEHFVFDVGKLNMSSFEVLLDINFVPASGGVTTTYGLNKSVNSRVGPVRKPGGIVEDSGGVTAVVAADPSWSDIAVTKKVRFAFWKNSFDFWVNFWGSVALQAASDELYEGVCCQT